MQQFIKSFIAANDKPGIAYTDHKFFGRAKFECEKLHIICDDSRMGISIKDRDLYIPTVDIREFVHKENEFVIKSDGQQIKIIVNNL